MVQDWLLVGTGRKIWLEAKRREHPGVCAFAIPIPVALFTFRESFGCSYVWY